MIVVTISDYLETTKPNAAEVFGYDTRSKPRVYTVCGRSAAEDSLVAFRERSLNGFVHTHICGNSSVSRKIAPVITLNGDLGATCRWKLLKPFDQSWVFSRRDWPAGKHNAGVTACPVRSVFLPANLRLTKHGNGRTTADQKRDPSLKRLQFLERNRTPES